MSVVEPERPEDWQIETGRSDGGRTFMRFEGLTSEPDGTWSIAWSS